MLFGTQAMTSLGAHPINSLASVLTINLTINLTISLAISLYPLNY